MYNGAVPRNGLDLSAHRCSQIYLGGGQREVKNLRQWRISIKKIECRKILHDVSNPYPARTVAYSVDGDSNNYTAVSRSGRNNHNPQ